MVASGPYEISGLTGSLCTMTIKNGVLEEIWTIGKYVTWDPENPNRRLLWRRPNKDDVVWMVADLNEVIKYLEPALKKVESVWDQPSAAIQGVVPKNDFTGELERRTCEDYNFSSPGFDHLRVFYNETGWERLFPEPVSQQETVWLSENVSQCAGWQNVSAPWKLYNRNRNDWMKQRGIVSSGRWNGKPVPYEPVLFNGSYIGASLHASCDVLSMHGHSNRLRV